MTYYYSAAISHKEMNRLWSAGYGVCKLTSALSGPMTFCSRKIKRAFCRTKLLIATPKTFPMLRQRIRVLVTTACSACEETARTLMNVPGNKNPVDYVVSYSTNQNYLRMES
jgi:hypothetical protein